jgi:hypothetical protein
MKVLVDAALRRAACFVLALTASSIATAQVWIANPAALPSDHWCNPPVLESIVGDAPSGNHAVSWSWIIRFNVQIYAGVHENFGAEMLPPRTLNQLAPAEGWPSSMTDQQIANLYMQEFPDAHYVFVFPHNAIVSDCDGDGMPILGPGTPPCWGEPVGMLERTDSLHPTLLRSGRSSGGVCVPEAKFKLQVSAFPLINRGAVGIRIKGKNAGLWLGMSAWSTEDHPASGHGWVHFWKMRGGVDGGPGHHFAFGKWPKDGANPWLNYWPFAPGQIRNDSLGMGMHTAWFPVTIAEYDAALAVVRREQARPSGWSLASNCVDFAVEVMTAAGCPIPESTESAPATPGLHSPRAFNRACRRILQEQEGVLGRCGFVANFEVQALGGQQGLFDAGIIAEQLLDDPQALATALKYSHASEPIGAVSLRPGSPLTLSITRPEESLVLVDFGDGTVTQHGQSTLTHAYSVPAKRIVRVLAIQNGTVSEHTLVVEIAAKSPFGAVVDCTVAPAPPVEFSSEVPPFSSAPWERTFPADVNCDWIADGSDLAIILAEWGSVFPTMADIDDDGVVDANDLSVVLAGWGAPGK